MMASMAAAAAAAGGTEREIRQATAFTREHEKDLERITRHSSILSADMKRQKKHCGAVRKTFDSKKPSFLSGLRDEDVEKLTAETFLTYCVYPRCRLTPEDALYCAEFVMLLHKMEVSGFYTLKYVDRLINAVVGAAYSITEDEAGNLSILLKSTWGWIKNWRDDKALFEKEVAGKVRPLRDGVFANYLFYHLAHECPKYWVPPP
jgi:THO complex subunit 2